MSGVTENRQESEGQMNVGAGEEGPPKRKKLKAIVGENRLMGFGPNHRWAYGKVLRSKPRYVRFPIEEGGGNNRTSIFTQWAMGFMVDTFFEWGGKQGWGTQLREEARWETGK